MSAPSFLAWVPPVAAAATATTIANYTFANNGGPGDTITDTLGTSAALSALNTVFGGHTVAVGDRLLVANQTSATYQNGIYVASTVESAFGQIATVTLTAGGSGFTNGQYYNVAVTTTSGSGTGALFDVTVVGGVVTAISVAQLYSDAPGSTPAGTDAIASGTLAGGSGYAVNDTITALHGIGNGTGLTVTVATLQPSFVLTRASDSNTATQLQGQSVFTAAGLAYVQTTTPLTLDVTSQISGTGAIVQPTASANFPVVAGTYTNIPLAGGHGTGAGATVVVGANTGLATVTITTAGSGYNNNTAGTFNNVPLTTTTGFGSGATADITVAVTSGAVTAATIVNAGSGYAVGNTLSASNANLGGTGSGLVLTVATVSAAGGVTSVTVTSVGSGYQNGDVLSFGVYSGSGVSTGGVYGLGSGGTVAVTTSTPASSAVTFVAMSAL